MIIMNLTNHKITDEQIEELYKRFPIKETDELLLEPQNVTFEDYFAMLEWAEEIIRKVKTAKEPVILICGGNTAAFMLLMRQLTHRSAPNVTFITAITERIRDENDRFVFNFGGWLLFDATYHKFNKRRD